MFPVFYDRSRELLHELASSQIVRKYLVPLGEHHQDSRFHTLRTCLLSIDMAMGLGLPEPRVKRVGLIALMHDIGKVGVNSYVLDKEGKLTDEEWTALRGHPRIGFNMLLQDPVYKRNFGVCQGAIAVHEWQRRSPYPRSGKDRRKIPRPGVRERRRSYPLIAEESQIVAAADKYEALSADRPYRKAFSPEKIDEIIRKDYTGQPRILNEALRRNSSKLAQTDTGMFLKLVN